MTGSLKYDGAHTDRSNSRTQSLRELAGISDDDIVFLAGSTQEPEEQYALNIFRRLSPRYPRLRLILVPRHPERFDAVAKLLEGSKLPWTLRSVLAAQPSAELADNKSITLRVPGGTFNQPQALPGVPAPVLLVDTVGELGAWWGTTHIAFVGGSFGSRGGQNMLEPAAYGAAVSFGPNTRNFRDIVAALLTAGGAVVVNDSNAFESFVERCLDEPKFAADLGQQARALVQSNLGATARTISLVEELLRHVPTTRQLTAA
jgi:3-deoxy-D-manno-octulosonic-acid transferase